MRPTARGILRAGEPIMPSGDRSTAGGPQTRDELDDAIARVLAELVVRSIREDLAREAQAGQAPAAPADVPMKPKRDRRAA